MVFRSQPFLLPLERFPIPTRFPGHLLSPQSIDVDPSPNRSEMKTAHQIAPRAHRMYMSRRTGSSLLTLFFSEPCQSLKDSLVEHTTTLNSWVRAQDVPNH